MLPLTYNLNPSLLDTLPFLYPRDDGEDFSASFPMDHGVKVVHLWHWYNPILAASGSARQAMQLNARLKHRVLWNWYDLWWKMH
eukprot:CAMPEP_0198581908 /NCGR_PEP_ID=MMETSP1462-20131121/124852_1 /TAXON_ID=1333877 /ORGANISM="Brandtodinium nutriculum, Strain RCC3387" /LENGTH=83 /DNA_ID=CAMNT_0044313297 /DNA_START=25 /DNA_END=273 /DNA_ORIENTATION=+